MSRTSASSTGAICVLVGLFSLAPAAGRAYADVCLAIDEAHDNFSPQDRAAALLLLARQFELSGEHVVPPPCPAAYTVAHVRLGTRVSITLSGPNGERDATAIGMDDVPAVYSQMVRSLLRGVPMNAPGVVDRTNVSETQASRRRIYSDSVVYARLGYGAIFGDRTYDGPSVTMFGYRKELDAVAIDVSFFNFQYKSSDRSYNYGLGQVGSSGMTGAWLKLEALRFMTPLSDRSFFMGGGLSWSAANLDNANTSWSGSGIQGELTAGYEVGRASTLRVFMQTDVGLPFYRLRSETFTYSPTPPYGTTAIGHRYVPTLSASVGLGWQRGGGK